MTALFISDCHLNTSRPDRLSDFFNFLKSCPDKSQLYILGDLFDLYLGDDDDRSPIPEIKQALKQAGNNGVQIFIMYGNHDFVMGAEFEEQTGCIIIQDPTVIELSRIPVLLMHGDTLCTHDVEYQEYRRMIRDEKTLKDFLAMPLQARVDRANEISNISRDKVSQKGLEIMDVSQMAVDDAMLLYRAQILIHGHTHRPAIYHWQLKNKKYTRMVLAPWYESSSVLVYDEKGFHTENTNYF